MFAVVELFIKSSEESKTGIIKYVKWHKVCNGQPVKMIRLAVKGLLRVLLFIV